jgi:hypothetical protein
MTAGTLEEAAVAGDPLGAWLRDDDGGPWTDLPDQRDGLEGADRADGGIWGGGPQQAASHGDEDGDDGQPSPPPFAQPFPWDQQDDHPGRGRRLRRLVAVPWIVAAVLGVVAVTGGRGQPAQGQPAGSQPAGSQPGAGQPDAGGLTLGDGWAAPVVGGPAAPPVDGAPAVGGDQDLLAAAAMAVRTGLTGPTGAAGDQVRYVDLALGESVAWTAGDVAVVTVAAVVLDGSGGRCEAARTARYAVPVQRLDGRAVALASPWPLPAPAEPPDPPAWEPITAPELAGPVLTVLAGAGFEPVGGVELSRDPALVGVLRARLEAVGPGEGAARVHELWLRDGPAPSLLGLPDPPADPAVNPPADPPADRASGAATDVPTAGTP